MLNDQNKEQLKSYELILQKEILDLDEIDGIELFQLDESQRLNKIGVSIKVKSGYFKNKIYKFILTFKETYPITPPKIICLNKIFHPNIDDKGNVCMNVLKLEWNPIINLQMLILGLLLLLTEPSLEDPFNEEAMNIFKNDKTLFEKINNSIYKPI